MLSDELESYEQVKLMQKLVNHSKKSGFHSANDRKSLKCFKPGKDKIKISIEKIFLVSKYAAEVESNPGG